MNTELLNDFESLTPAAVIEEVLRHQDGLACITCSFQIEDMVVLHLLRKYRPDIPVLFLETGYHFAETYAYRDLIAQRWKLNVINVAPKTNVAEHESQLGMLYLVDPTRCCKLRKVEPLMSALADYDIWFTGLRREQSPTRKNLKKVEPHQLPGDGRTILKVSPLVDWQWSQVLDYAAENNIERLPLYEKGYLSIGCEPCTRLPVDASDPRSGRWSGKKLECGIHTFTGRSEG